MEFNQTIVAVQLIKAIIICVLSVLIERMLLSSSSFTKNQTVQIWNIYH